MEKKTGSMNKFVKAAIWVVVILALMASMHILIHNFELFEFVRKLHGG